MASVKKYDLSGDEVESVEIDDALLEISAHPQSVKDYLVALRNNQRQWSAHTKTRAEINRTGRKPHPQKGGGRSRQGDLAAPHYKGGGIVFGPRAKGHFLAKGEVRVRINQKEKRAAIRSLLAEKIKGQRVHILRPELLEKPKTKKMASFFQKLDLSDARILVLGNLEERAAHQNLVRSLRNIPKKEYCLLPQVNGYSLARARDLVILESAFLEFLTILKRDFHE